MLPALLMLASHPVGRSCIVCSEFIFKDAPFPSCHASTIEGSHGHLVAAWFGGTHEGAPDVGIWVSIKQAGKWSPPKEAATGTDADGRRLPCWNPVLFEPRGGPLMLFYKVGPWPAAMRGMVMRSEDGGHSWSRPEALPNGILGPIKNKPIQLQDGTIVSPSSDESDGWRVHFEWSEDLGRTWYRTGPLNESKKIAAIQPTVLQIDQGHLAALGRTKQGRIFSIASSDNGRTWGPMRLTELPNPDSGIDSMRLADGRFVLVYNPTTKGRSPLSVAISNGKDLNWTPVVTLENRRGGEFSYPAVIQSKDGLIHVTYTWNRRRIKHVVIDPTKIPRLTDLPTSP